MSEEKNEKPKSLFEDEEGETEVKKPSKEISSEEEKGDEVTTDKESPEKTSRESKKSTKNKGYVKTLLLVTLVLFLGLLGVFFGIQLIKGEKEVAPTTTTTKADVKTTTTTKAPENIVYVSAIEGLNLRQQAVATSELIATMPFGSKLKVVEESGEWIKVEYKNNIGWCMKTYTSATNPLVYKDTELGFELTFPEEWSGFKTYTKDSEDGTKIIYFALKTTDATHPKEEGFELGYESLFALNIMSKTAYEVIKNEGGPQPTLIKEEGDKVYAWGQSNAWTEDLNKQLDMVKSIIETFKLI